MVEADDRRLLIDPITRPYFRKSRNWDELVIPPVVIP